MDLYSNNRQSVQGMQQYSIAFISRNSNSPSGWSEGIERIHIHNKTQGTSCLAKVSKTTDWSDLQIVDHDKVFNCTVGFDES